MIPHRPFQLLILLSAFSAPAPLTSGAPLILHTLLYIRKHIQYILIQYTIFFFVCKGGFNRNTVNITLLLFFLQIIFDGFSVGRFDEGLLDSDSDRNESHYSNHIGDLPGCPEGFMQVINLYRFSLFLSFNVIFF